MTNAPTTPTSTATRSSPSNKNGAGDQAKAEARNVAEKGKEGASQVADEARSQAADLARTAREEARQRADAEVGKLAGFLDEIGDELDGMAESSDGYLPALARDGAKTVNRLSKRLETGGLDGALDDVRMFARRRPGMFLAAALGAGLVLGRVTRNADLHSISEEMQDGDETGQSDSTPQSRQPATEPTATMPASTTPGVYSASGVRPTP